MYPFLTPLLFSCGIHKYMYANGVNLHQNYWYIKENTKLQFGYILTILSPKLGKILRNSHLSMHVNTANMVTQAIRHTLFPMFWLKYKLKRSTNDLRCLLQAITCFIRIKSVQSLNKYLFIINLLQFLIIS